MGCCVVTWVCSGEQAHHGAHVHLIALMLSASCYSCGYIRLDFVIIYIIIINLYLCTIQP